jgi:uncharacterized protein (TIGR00730 family)
MNENNRPRKKEVAEPLTLAKINSDINNRIENITNEFREGFDFIKNQTKSVTFFGSARTIEDEKDYQNARELAKKIATELNYAVFTGGGPGIMEAANRGAFENKGESYGLTIKLPNEQVTNPYLTHNMDFYYFFSRKVCMSYSAESYVYFPGGFGTLDELFEILTLVQTNKIEKVPIILINSEFWKPFDSFIKNTLLASEKINDEDAKLYTITDDLNEAIEIIKNAPIKIAE